MSKDVYILSTLTADQLYTVYAPGGADLPLVERQVFVKGGANVADKRLVTPQGVVTKVSAEDYEILKDHEVFKLHKTNGFVTVSTSKPADADAAAASQASRDGAAPLVEGDFAPGKAPTAGTGTEGEGVQTAVRGSSRRA